MKQINIMVKVFGQVKHLGGTKFIKNILKIFGKTFYGLEECFDNTNKKKFRIFFW